MRFYNATRFLFPRSYEYRIMLVCFGAMHIPLVVYTASMAVRGDWDWTVFYVLLGATLIGTIFGIFSLHALLKPIGLATDMLDEVHSGHRIEELPSSGDDLVGRLFRGVAVAAEKTAARVTDLSRAAATDALTGLNNRRGFIDGAARALDGTKTSVMAIIDIDYFKKINDTHGHEVGDEILADFARQIEDSVRRSDLTARWGGEEFAVLLPDTTLEEARNIILRLRTKIAATSSPESGPAYTFSCGLSVIRAYDELKTATRRADEALYAAKCGGRDRVESAD
jgi:diguanylate cyclase